MSLKKLHTNFINIVAEIYDANEAENIWQLTVENLTGINLRADKHANFIPDGCFVNMIQAIQSRLQKHEPIQYILNEAWFYDIPFFVNKNVLIPRPETEELVDWIIKEHSTKEKIKILDVGTGSGCIPIILKRKMANAEILSCDISLDAIDIAKKNAAKYKVYITFLNIDFLNNNNWHELPKVDIIVSNPPYIPKKETTTMHENVLQYEPHSALFVNNNAPFIFYEAIIKAAKEILNTNGCIYVEIHGNAGANILNLFEKNGFSATIKKDMQGKDRMIKAAFKNAALT